MPCRESVDAHRLDSYLQQAGKLASWDQLQLSSDGEASLPRCRDAGAAEAADAAKGDDLRDI